MHEGQFTCREGSVVEQCLSLITSFKTVDFTPLFFLDVHCALSFKLDTNTFDVQTCTRGLPHNIKSFIQNHAFIFTENIDAEKVKSFIEKLTHTNDINKIFINNITTEVANILLESAAKTCGRYNNTEIILPVKKNNALIKNVKLL